MPALRLSGLVSTIAFTNDRIGQPRAVGDLEFVRRSYTQPMNERLELYSPLPPDECAKRLSEAIDSERSALFSFLSLFGSHPVAGHVDVSSLKLRKRIRHNNSFQSYLTATMRPEGSGTVISGDFAMHPFVWVFLAIWFTGVTLIGGAVFIVTVGAYISGSPLRGDKAWMGVVSPLVVIGFGLALVRFGRFLARNEVRFIKDFLMQALNASDRNA